jgi:threonine/homoserine efflux transporter RhtA
MDPFAPGSALRLTVAPRTRWLFLAVIVTQVADLATFLPAIARVGIGAEQNPIARTMFMTLGAAGPIVLKIGATGVVLILLWRVADRFPAFAGRSTLVAVLLGILGAWSNVTFGLAS